MPKPMAPAMPKANATYQGAPAGTLAAATAIRTALVNERAACSLSLSPSVYITPALISRARTLIKTPMDVTPTRSSRLSESIFSQRYFWQRTHSASVMFLETK